MDDDKAVRLVELEIKRNRTQADLEAVQVMRRSIRRSMEAYMGRHDNLMQQYEHEFRMDEHKLEVMEQVFREWNEALVSSTAEFGTLVAEWERVQVQEQILIRMLRELDRQIEELKVTLR